MINAEQIFHYMLNMMFALGCRFLAILDKQNTVSSDSWRTFYIRATQLMTLDCTENGSISLVQGLLLTVQCIQTMELSNKCWVVLGMAIRVAQSIALWQPNGIETQAQREERKRTWCVCILLDR